jgi:hypothetical protein
MNEDLLLEREQSGEQLLVQLLCLPHRLLPARD